MKKLRHSGSGSVEVEGATLRYVIEGTGTPVLVVGSAVYYPRTFSQRLRASCRLAFVDLRHFAENDGTLSPDRITVERYVEDIESARTTLGFERFILVGHSHHGNVALEYAKCYPDKISHLVLIGTPPCDVQHTIEEGRRYWSEQASAARQAALKRNHEALGDRLASMPPGEAFIAQYVADGPKYWHDPGYDASTLWRDVPVNTDIIDVFRGFFTGYEFTWDVARLKAPVLAVMGKHDYVVPHTLWDEVLPTMQNVTYRLLQKSGHTPQLEEPAAFDKTLLEWLKQERGVNVV